LDELGRRPGDHGRKRSRRDNDGRETATEPPPRIRIVLAAYRFRSAGDAELIGTPGRIG